MESVVIFQVVTLWGHPEDVVALGLALYALMASFRGRWSLSGLALGCRHRRPSRSSSSWSPWPSSGCPAGTELDSACYGALPSVLLLSAPLATEWQQTSGDPPPPGELQFLDHATPWIALSPT